jgi:hypothetical protein
MLRRGGCAARQKAKGKNDLSCRLAMQMATAVTHLYLLPLAF